MVDSTKFGLTQDIEVKFFTPEEAAKTPGASAGYNAVHKIGDRIRYELLKASKTSEEPVAVVKQVEPAKPTKQPKQPKVVEPVQAKEEVVVTESTEKKEEPKAE